MDSGGWGHLSTSRALVSRHAKYGCYEYVEGTFDFVDPEQMEFLS